MTHITTAIIETLSYAAVFNFPLTVHEVYTWLITDVWYAPKIVQTAIEQLLRERHLVRQGIYLQLPHMVCRNRNALESTIQQKYKTARHAALFLSVIPTIHVIGISGALAADAANSNDDIDFYIICAKGTLWTTRLLSVLIAELIGLRRRPNDTWVNNKICLNMFVDEKHLEVPKEEQDIFSAHEVLQMRPIFSSGNMYQQFLLDNQWTRKYLANAWENKVKSQKLKVKSNNTDSSILNVLISFIAYTLEPVAQKIQLWYMRKRRTTEYIASGIVRFHPHDARKKILRKYQQILQGNFTIGS